METDIYLQLAERIDTTSKRYKTVIAYRNDMLKEIKKFSYEYAETIQQAVEHTFTSGKDSKVQYFDDKMNHALSELMEKTERDFHTLEVLNQVLTHEMHLPMIIDLYQKLEDDVRQAYQSHFNNLVEIFNITTPWLVNAANNSREQLNALNQLKTEKSIIQFLKWKELYDTGIRTQDDLRRRLTPIKAKIMETAKYVNKLIQGSEELIMKHKKALAILLLLTSAASLILPVLLPAQTLMGGVIATITGASSSLVHGGHVTEAVAEIFKKA